MIDPFFGSFYKLDSLLCLYGVTLGKITERIYNNQNMGVFMVAFRVLVEVIDLNYVVWEYRLFLAEI